MDEIAKILIADDDPLIRSATERMLKSSGYQTLLAADGQEALDLAKIHRPDLILMDVNMPKMEGLEALQHIKADPNLASVWVIIVSGSRIDTDSQVRGLETGADGYLTRPISNRELLARIQSMLRIKTAEEAIRRKEKQLRDLISINIDGMLVVDKDGRALFANRAACELLNRPETSLDGEIVGVPISAGEHIEVELLRPDGGRRIVEMRVVELEWQSQPAILASLRDITERKRVEDAIRNLNIELEARVEARTRELREAQEQLVRHEKLAVLGQMAGSVSHELRNPLSVISNAVYFLKMTQPGASEKVREYLDIIETENHNADKIINDLLDFSRIKSVEVEPVVVSDLVTSTLNRIPPPENVDVTLNLPEDLPILYVDPRQITQVLGNLVLNACQAMPAGGRLTVDGGQLTVDGQSSVVIAVSDTGVGIPPENMQKLFEPLFTTKPKGIGLGLPVCKNLVEANGGRIEVESEPGQGSLFKVFCRFTTMLLHPFCKRVDSVVAQATGSKPG